MVTSSNLTNVVIVRLLTARAGTTTARSASLPHEPCGLIGRPRRFCPSSTSTWFSLCLNPLLRWPFRTLGRFTAFCSGRHPRRCCRLLPIQKHLGERIAFLAVLHTWGQNLHHHPHLHCVVPGGGISLDGSRWVSTRKKFFLPVKVLSRLFRGKFVAYLKQAVEQGRLAFRGKIEALGDRGRFLTWLDDLTRSEWVVYAKPPFGGPRQVLKCLARYTHRVAISNRRLISLQAGGVTFQWKGYARGNHLETMTLAAIEFIRRFLLHVLPSGFVKIRHYGFLGNRCRRQRMALCRKLLSEKLLMKSQTADACHDSAPEEPKTEPVDRCPICRLGRMKRVEIVPPEPVPSGECVCQFPVSLAELDTS